MRDLLPAPLEEMWFGRPAPEISFACGKDEVEARLRKKFAGFMEEGLRGSVRKDRVSLFWNTPGFGNAWRPVFHGRLAGDSHVSRIEGVFSAFRFTQVFCIVWFGGLVLFALIGLITIVFPLACMLMMAVGVGLVALGQHLSRKEKQKIIAAVREL